MPKTIPRQTMLDQRRQLSPQEVVERSLAAQERLLAWPRFHRVHTVALYAPVRNEVATDRLFAALVARGARAVYPLVVGDDLTFHQVQQHADLLPGHFGVAEPSAESPQISEKEIELVVVPGVAFDRSGHRLGYGKGYYDRFLAARHEAGGRLIGLCYDFQLVESLPVEEHDVPMDLLVTDRQLYDPARCAS